MTWLFRGSAIVFFLLAVASGIWGVKESHWAYLIAFGTFSTFATFLFILSHPASQEH